MGIKIEALRLFIEVAELGNISDAAAKLGRTPSAVSMALKQLEENIGGALFESDRKSQLTALGAFVLETARDEVRRFDRTVAAMRAYATNTIGRLDVACVPSVASHLLPRIIARFIADRPGIVLDLRDTDSRTVQVAVEREQVDIGIAGRPGGRGPIRFETLFRDRFVLVCGIDNPLAKRRGILKWQDLEGQIFIQNGAAEALNSAPYHSISAHAKLMVRNNTSLLALVRSNVGVTLLPRLSVPSGDRGLKALAVADERLCREVGILTRNGSALSPAATAFTALLRETLPVDIGEDPFGRRRAESADGH